MSLSIIVAVSQNNVIGDGGAMPWKLSADLAYFKRVTTGKTVIMGRKTYESIGRPLPNRLNVVVSRTLTETPSDGVLVVSSLEEAFKFIDIKGDEEVFVIGGGEIYKETLPMADKVYATLVCAEFEGDTFFPELNKGWEIIDSEIHKADEKNTHDYIFNVYVNKNIQVSYEDMHNSDESTSEVVHCVPDDLQEGESQEEYYARKEAESQVQLEAERTQRNSWAEAIEKSYGENAISAARTVLIREFEKDKDPGGFYHSYMANMSCVINDALADKDMPIDMADSDEIAHRLMSHIFSQ